RTSLVRARLEVLLRVERRMYALERLAGLMTQATRALVDSKMPVGQHEHWTRIRGIVVDLVWHELKALRAMGLRRQPYSALVRQRTSEFMLGLANPEV
ncbi:hypothetical protein OAX78_01905, partial [Planctomycetota bacterium]|nr:hypothetical protein [Planctomycetota bacterium]